jgi:hypothetical protein
MALARIITRSQACSQELALDLLARGYAVEIVSPDQIPDNLADLELRVDTPPGDQLIANVKAHHGERLASFEFVHHLKAPMVDFRRRLPGSPEVPHLPEQPVRTSPEPSIEAVQSPADTPQSAVVNIFPKAETPLQSPLDCDPNSEPHPNPDPSPEEGARQIATEVPSQEPMKPPSYFAVKDGAMNPVTKVLPVIVPPRPAKQRRDHSPEGSAGRRWSATLTFVGIVLLAVVLAFDMRHAGTTAPQGPERLNAEKVAAPSVAAPSAAADPSIASPDFNRSTVADSVTDRGRPENVSSSALPTAPENSDSSHASEAAQIAKGVSLAATAHTRVSHQDEHDLIARDTVTYLDKRFEPASKQKRTTAHTRQHPKPRPQSGGVIAANSVIYLNKKSAPKAAK